MLKYIVEIKNRLILILFTVLSLLSVTYAYKEVLFFLFVKPYQIVSKLDFDYFISTSVTDIFSIYLKLVYFMTIQISFVLLVYHCFIFINNALFKQEYYFFVNFLKLSLFFWFFNIFLSSYILIPLSWDFFFSFQSLIANKFISLYFEPKINEYFDFCFYLYYICLFYCQVFTVLFFLAIYYSQSEKVIKKWRKFYYYSFLIFSTLVTPPDIFSQLLICFSLICFYEFLVFWLILKNKTN